ncbi:MAG: hypothetical protein QXT86_08455 [Archaeoglobaceae archaeon]
MDPLNLLSENELLILATIHGIKKRVKGIPASDIYDAVQKIGKDFSTTAFHTLLARLNTAGFIELRTNRRDPLFGYRVYKKIEDNEFEEMLSSNERLRNYYETITKALKKSNPVE